MTETLALFLNQWKPPAHLACQPSSASVGTYEAKLASWIRRHRLSASDGACAVCTLTLVMC